MSKFGWSYPPGCNGPPEEEDQPCHTCGQSVACPCPDCPVCGAVGDPACYVPGSHGLSRSEIQRRSLEAAMEAWQADALAGIARFLEIDALDAREEGGAA